MQLEHGRGGEGGRGDGGEGRVGGMGRERETGYQFSTLAQPK